VATQAHQKCWAKSLGRCATKLSREHLFSDGLFDEPQIVVSGYPWLKGETRVIGAAALTRKILCATHNSALSPVDQAACDLFRDFFRDLNTAAEQHAKWRLSTEPGTWQALQTTVDGSLLERWLVKTTVNHSLAGRSDLRWHLNDQPIVNVPHNLVEAAFGMVPLSHPMGLYAAVSVGITQESTQEVSFAPIIKAGRHVSGGTFGLRGLHYLLWLENRDVPSPPSRVIPHDWPNPQIVHHPARMDYSVQGHDSHNITYRW
jgi:hypothetical protein